MAIKQLTREEVIDKLKEEKCFHGFIRNNNIEEWEPDIITGFDFCGHDNNTQFFTDSGLTGYLCGININDDENKGGK